MPCLEADRLAMLRDFELLRAGPDPALDRLARMATHLLDRTAAWICFQDQSTSWIRASHGIDLPDRMPRGETICERVVAARAALDVPDLSRDHQFGKNPFVLERGLRSYAGVPILAPDRGVLGVVATMGRTAGPVPEGGLDLLSDLAALVWTELSTRTAARGEALGASPAAPFGHVPAARFPLKALSALQEGVVGVDGEGIVRFCNPAAEQLLGRPSAALLGRTVGEALRGDAREAPADACPIRLGLRDGTERIVRSQRFLRGAHERFDVEYVASPLRRGGGIVGASVVFRDCSKDPRRGIGALREGLREVGRLREALGRSPLADAPHPFAEAAAGVGETAARVAVAG